MSTHNLGVFSYEEKLNDDDEDYHSNNSETTTATESENEFNEQTELARTQQLRLQERLVILERTLNNLRHQLREEREMWRREVNEMSMTTPYCHDGGELGARISADAFIHNNNNNNNASSVNLELETKSSYTADSYNERKLALQRQIAYSNFQRRLLEVENMCNLELLRVKQSAQFLEPLRVMASEWNSKTEDESHGDGERVNMDEENCESKQQQQQQHQDGKQQEVKKSVKDVSDAVELIGSKLYNEINEMFNKVTPAAWHTSSEESTVSNSNSTSSGTYMSDGSQNSNNA